MRAKKNGVKNIRLII